MRKKGMAAAVLVLGLVGVSSLQDAVRAANISNHIEAVRRNASIVYLGVVNDIVLSEYQRWLRARAVVRVLFVARSNTGEAPSMPSLEYATWDDEHPPYAGDGQYRLEPGMLVIVFADSWGGDIRYLLKGEREELLKDLEARQSGLAGMSEADLQFNQIDEDDRLAQLQLYHALTSHLKSVLPRQGADTLSE